MRPRHLLLSLAIAVLLPSQAQAEVKSYDLDVLITLNTTTLTITGFTRALLTGPIEIRDEMNSQPTLVRLDMVNDDPRTNRTDVFAGQNSFVHIRRLFTVSPVPGQTGTGDTEGFVKWNPLSSWTALGGIWCRGSNEVGNPLGGPICPVLGWLQEATVPATVPSENYDFNLWTFDAEGDISSAGYLWSITSGGSSNLEWAIRGDLQVNVPALSAGGFLLLGASIMFLGARALRKRDKD